MMHDLIETYLDRIAGLKSDETHKTFTSNMRQFEQWLNENDYDICNIEPLELEQYFIQMNNEGYAPNTVANRFESVRGFYQFLSDKLGAIEQSPVEDLKRSDYVQKGTKKHDHAELVYITPEEKELMCENVPTPTLRNELIIRLLWQTGVRKSELVEIEIEDIDREARSIDVWSNKTKEWRTVYYQPSLDLLMEQWIDGGYRSSYMPAEDSPYLFVTERSDQMSPKTVNRKIVRQAAENADIQEVMYTDNAGQKRYRITAHTLRHGHGVQALKSGIDVRTVQKHLGHAKLEMTMKYLQLVDSDVREGYRRFGTSADD
jgi:integrase/recombinase XerD